MFSRAPVEILSMHTTSSPRFKKLSQRWEPIKPAPPVIRILAIVSANRIVGETQLPEVRGVIDVAAVKDHRTLEHCFDQLEVRPAKLVPFGDYQQSVRTLQCIIIAMIISHAVSENFSGF